MLRDLLAGNRQTSVQVGDLMSFPVFSVTSDTPMTAVAGILRRKGCTGLPVVDDGKLVRIVTEHDFMELSRRLLERWLREAGADVLLMTAAVTDYRPHAAASKAFVAAQAARSASSPPMAPLARCSLVLPVLAAFCNRS